MYIIGDGTYFIIYNGNVEVAAREHNPWFVVFLLI